MKYAKALFDFYINGSIHVALSVCALCTITYINFRQPVSVALLLFVFAGTVTGYNFVKYAGLAKWHHRSLTKRLRAIQVFSFINFLGLLYMVFQQSSAVILVSAILGVITLLYAVPFLPQHKNLRNLKSLKIFVIALVWAGVTVLLPLVDAVDVWSVSVLLSGVQYYVFVLALIIPFEIRDLAFDSFDLGTFPQLYGVQKTKIFGYVLIALFAFLGLIAGTGINEDKLVEVLLIPLVLAISIHGSSERQSSYYASFWVEGIPIVWCLLSFLTR